MRAENGCSDMNPLVTVIVPSYNHEPYIRQAIESVISQSYKILEIIVIDDGSHDQSLTIINNLAVQHGFIAISRENRGLAKTLNEGIELATGKYICILASDDYYLPHRIEQAVSHLEKSPDKVAMVYCDGYIIDDEGRRICVFSEKYPRPLIGSIYNNLLVGNWIPAMGVTYKATVLKQFTFDERFKIEDHSLYLRIYQDKKYDLVFYKDYGFAYRWHENNTSNCTEFLDSENNLLQHYFEDAGSYAKFRQHLKSREFVWSVIACKKNIYLLILHAIRAVQIKLRKCRTRACIKQVQDQP